jgi:hypothetical protein
VGTFRKVCRFLHREFGYFAVGLTVVYAISGVAVNHVHHWNPNYADSVETYRIDPIDLETAGDTRAITETVLARLALDEPVKNTWRASPERLDVFVEGATLEVHLPTGAVTRRGLDERPLLFDVNFMHLNAGKGFWTVVADFYAVLLFVLAITGIFLVRGKKGLAGRGGVWMGLGLVLPIAYVLVVRYL